jgi:ParB family protein of integrating conjugative element (PFGI_1 class)
MSDDFDDFDSLLNRPYFEQQHTEVPPDPAVPTMVSVNLDNLVAYDGNPRQSRNPAYDDIKESIRSIGLQNPPNVTRQDPSQPYMIRDGGNTRLQILKELWEETGERRFYEFKAWFHPFTSDIDLLVKHCVENEMRGGMLLVERGLAALKIKSSREAAQGQELSTLGLSKHLKDLGWSVGDKSLGLALYGAQQLVECIPLALWAGLGKEPVQKIRIATTTCRDYWLSLEEHKADPKAASEEFEMVWREGLSAVDAEDLTATQAVDAIELALAEYLGCPVMNLRGELQAFGRGVSTSGKIPDTVLTGNVPDVALNALKAREAARTAGNPGGASPKAREVVAPPPRETGSSNGDGTGLDNPEILPFVPDPELDGEDYSEQPGGGGFAPQGQDEQGYFGSEDLQPSGAAGSNPSHPSLTVEELQSEIYDLAVSIAATFELDHLIYPTEDEGLKQHLGFGVAPLDDATAAMLQQTFNEDNIYPCAFYRTLLLLATTPSTVCGALVNNEPHTYALINPPTESYMEQVAFLTNRLCMRNHYSARHETALGKAYTALERLEVLAGQLLRIFANVV